MQSRQFPWTLVVVPVAIFCLMLFSLLSCSGASSKALTPIDIGTTKSEVNLLILVAQEQGYFARNGLELNHKLYSSGVAALSDMLEREVDLATGSEFAFAGQVLSGQELCALATINRSSLEYLVARQDRGIRTLEDLRGKAIGVPLDSRPEFALDRFLFFRGIDPADVNLVDVPVDQSVQALVDGTVDAVAAWQPYTDEMQAQLGDEVISWSVQEDQPSYSLLMARIDWADENSDIIVRFLKALVQAEDYIAANPEAAQAFLHQKMGFDTSYVANTWHEQSYSILLDQALVVAMEDQARWIMSRNLATGEEMPDFVDYMCVKGLEAAKPSALNLIR